MWNVNWLDALADISGLMIFTAIVWNIVWVTLFYIVMLAFSRVSHGLKSARGAAGRHRLAAI